jgi:hypothetical protein
MRASEDEKPDPSRKDMQGPAGQAGLDQLAERGRIERGMDKNNVPRSLQSQISPGRAEEITDPSQKLPMSERPEPRMTDSAFPPLPPRGTQATAGSGVIRLSSTVQQGQQMPSPSEADKFWEKKAPEKNFWENPLKYKGFEVIPSLNPHGGGLRFKKEF